MCNQRKKILLIANCFRITINLKHRAHAKRWLLVTLKYRKVTLLLLLLLLHKDTFAYFLMRYKDTHRSFSTFRYILINNNSS